MCANEQPALQLPKRWQPRTLPARPVLLGLFVVTGIQEGAKYKPLDLERTQRMYAACSVFLSVSFHLYPGISKRVLQYTVVLDRSVQAWLGKMERLREE